MPSANRSRVPRLTRHKASGRAVVRLSGKDHYCGSWGSPAARAEYDRLMGIWLANGRRMPGPNGEADPLTVTELAVRFLQHAQTHYRRPSGEPTREYGNFRVALRDLVALYGPIKADEFGPVALKSVRQRLVDRGNSRRVVNGQVSRIRLAFRWAVENELLPPVVLQGLLAVRGLQQGRSEARESRPVRPVPEADLEATLPHLPPMVADIVRVLTLTGMRVGELVVMRWQDIDRDGVVWRYEPREHKTAHHGRERVILLGPKAQAILEPYTESKGPVFSARESEDQRNALLRQRRQSPMTPSQASRRRKEHPDHAPGETYQTASVRRAIKRACEAAGVPSWSPHQLRHSAATRIRKEFGLDAARAVLGHSSATVTGLYAELDTKQARNVMLELG